MIISVVTPTFNRAYRLEALYNSLKEQTFRDFEWIIIDDGSTDNTDELIKKFIAEDQFNILYIQQENQGKHAALNNAIKLCKSVLFFIVDSDDELLSNSLEYIHSKYQNIKDNDKIAGLSGRRGYKNGSVIGNNLKYDEIICNAIDLRYKMKVKGDMAEVFKTRILKNYLFPVFDKEKFCPEALVWNRIALDFDMLWFNEIIYIGEYLPDGLTSKIFEIRKKSPQASCLYYRELATLKIPFTQKIKATINYLRFSIYSNDPFMTKLSRVNFSYFLIAFPFACLIMLYDRK